MKYSLLKVLMGFILMLNTSSLMAEPITSSQEYYIPPHVNEIPDTQYGEIVKWGRNIFINTQVYGKRYVGNERN